MSFLTIRPDFKSGDLVPQTFKTDKEHGNKTFTVNSKITDVETINNALTLNLQIEEGIDVTRELTVSKSKLYKKGSSSPFIFNDDGDGGYSFDVTTLITQNGDYNTLDYLYRNKIPVNITINTYAIPNGMYQISNAKKRQIIRPNVSEMDLTFSKYVKVQLSHKSSFKVDALTKKVAKCTLKKWTKKNKKKQDINDCNKVICQILNKKGLLKKKYVGTNWNVYYKVAKKTKVKVPKGSVGIVSATFVDGSKKKKVYPCKVALKNFKKKWNKKKLKPHLKENSKKDNNTLKALKRYKEL